MNSKIHQFNYLLICLFPIAYISGSFVSDLFVSLLAIFYLSYLIYFKKWDDFNSKLVIIIFFFWIYCLLRSLLSQNPILSLESSLFYIRFLFFALALKFYLNKFVNLKFHFGIILWGVTIFVTLDGLIQYSTGYNLLNYRADEYRISGIFGDEYVLGSFLSRVMPFCFYFLTISKNIGKKYLFWLCFS